MTSRRPITDAPNHMLKIRQSRTIILTKDKFRALPSPEFSDSKSNHRIFGQIAFRYVCCFRHIQKLLIDAFIVNVHQWCFLSVHLVILKLSKTHIFGENQRIALPCTERTGEYLHLERLLCISCSTIVQQKSCFPPGVVRHLTWRRMEGMFRPFYFLFNYLFFNEFLVSGDLQCFSFCWLNISEVFFFSFTNEIQKTRAVNSYCQLR